MSFKIYTKTGDKGETSLLGGTRVPKNHDKIECYGTIDELNSQIGLIISHIEENNDMKKNLEQIQSLLFVMGSYLAREEKSTFKLPPFEEKNIKWLEKHIDTMQEKLPSLTNFILPGGSITASLTHTARCICRRAERLCININTEKEIYFILKYLNRLSDYLFVLARFFNHEQGVQDKIWKGNIMI